MSFQPIYPYLTPYPPGFFLPNGLFQPSSVPANYSVPIHMPQPHLFAPNVGNPAGSPKLSGTIPNHATRKVPSQPPVFMPDDSIIEENGFNEPIFTNRRTGPEHSLDEETSAEKYGRSSSSQSALENIPSNETMAYTSSSPMDSSVFVTSGPIPRKTELSFKGMSCSNSDRELEQMDQRSASEKEGEIDIRQNEGGKKEQDNDIIRETRGRKNSQLKSSSPENSERRSSKESRGGAAEFSDSSSSSLRRKSSDYETPYHHFDSLNSASKRKGKYNLRNQPKKVKELIDDSETDDFEPNERRSSRRKRISRVDLSYSPEESVDEEETVSNFPEVQERTDPKPMKDSPPSPIKTVESAQSGRNCQLCSLLMPGSFNSIRYHSFLDMKSHAKVHCEQLARPMDEIYEECFSKVKKTRKSSVARGRVLRPKELNPAKTKEGLAPMKSKSFVETADATDENSDDHKTASRLNAHNSGMNSDDSDGDDINEEKKHDFRNTGVESLLPDDLTPQDENLGVKGGNIRANKRIDERKEFQSDERKTARKSLSQSSDSGNLPVPEESPTPSTKENKRSVRLAKKERHNYGTDPEGDNSSDPGASTDLCEEYRRLFKAAKNLPRQDHLWIKCRECDKPINVTNMCIDRHILNHLGKRSHECETCGSLLMLNSTNAHISRPSACISPKIRDLRPAMRSDMIMMLKRCLPIT